MHSCAMSKLSLLTLNNLLWRFTSEVVKGIYIKEKAYSTSKGYIHQRKSLKHKQRVYTSKKKPKAQAKGIYIKEKAYSTRLSCSKLGWDNPGLVQNFISDLKALEEKSVQFFFFNVVIKCSEENRYNYPKQALEQRNWRNLRFVL